MSSQLVCRCSSIFVSDGEAWHCPFSMDANYNHDCPVPDSRIGLTKKPNFDAMDLVDAIMFLRQRPREGRPGPTGLPGSRLRRQPWNQGKKRNGAKIQAKRKPSRREASLAAEWSVFMRSMERGLRRYERRGRA